MIPLVDEHYKEVYTMKMKGLLALLIGLTCVSCQNGSTGSDPDSSPTEGERFGPDPIGQQEEKQAEPVAQTEESN